MLTEPISVLLSIIASIDGIAVPKRVIGLIELVIDVGVYNTTVAVVRIIQIVDSVVVIIPVNIVFQTVTVNV